MLIGIWATSVFKNFQDQKDQIKREGYWRTKEFAWQMSQNLDKIQELSNYNAVTSMGFVSNGKTFAPNIPPIAPRDMKQSTFSCWRVVRDSTSFKYTAFSSKGSAVAPFELQLKEIPSPIDGLVFQKASKNEILSIYNNNRELCILKTTASKLIPKEFKQQFKSTDLTYAIYISSSPFSLQKDHGTILYNSNTMKISPASINATNKAGGNGLVSYFSFLQVDSIIAPPKGIGYSNIPNTNLANLIRWEPRFDLFKTIANSKVLTIVVIILFLIIFSYIFFESLSIYSPMFTISKHLKDLENGDVTKLRSDDILIPVPNLVPWKQFNSAINRLISSYQGVKYHIQRTEEEAKDYLSNSAQLEAYFQLNCPGLARSSGMQVVQFDVKNSEEISVELNAGLIDRYTNQPIIRLLELDDGTFLSLIFASPFFLSGVAASYCVNILTKNGIKDLVSFVNAATNNVSNESEAFHNIFSGITLINFDRDGNTINHAGTGQYKLEFVETELVVRVQALNPLFTSSLHRNAQPIFEPLSDVMEICRIRV